MAQTFSGRRTVAVLAISWTVLAGCGQSDAPPAVPYAQLTDTIPKAMERAEIPGAVVGVWQDDAAPYVQAFGVRDTATGDPMEPDVFTRIGSITKTFTTTAVLQLVDQGKIGLDDPIDRYVPDVPNGNTITIRQLAAMRSGLPDYTDVVIPALPSQPQRQWTPQELLGISFSRPPLFAPGAAFDYCNTNTVLLGLVVEKVSGRPLDAYIDEYIERPENLGHTSVPTDAAIPSPHAQGYTKTPDGDTVNATDWNPSWGFGAGNMISTLDDLGSWARDLATGTLLSPPTQREREQFQLAPSEGTGSLYGLGVEYQNGWIGHNGNTAGYQTYAYYLPPEDKTVVMLVNSNVDPLGVWNLFADIVKIISPDHPWPAPPS
ncbi:MULTISPECIES: serine hydrolase [unclassified Rhodococcus (in: high G+C Gram-positive bacteria)]|uniref:serine hydrolase domain-containing protein n=1 Tax=unclassified Rhodococcus (in: high G+C Gram-positive bacteria) TaxID=192944 RepID=UPI00163B25DE|nr:MULTISPECIES: serine hydrolase domain-containing protein [unclassified Rhodococcus (in: high G+C Gram-positive bacteria)]MBC2644015.1 beta-lactamase family protein [Rhodococcus sp. 3A]MBC2891246.1 beta-lactamase family protein [Rhodococcus sp. 4CII]